ncbi:hypothetical protein YC2023_117295 [Brassica napus]
MRRTKYDVSKTRRNKYDKNKNLESSIFRLFFFFSSTVSSPTRSPSKFEHLSAPSVSNSLPPDRLRSQKKIFLSLLLKNARVIRCVFDFLDSWGLINYSSSTSAKPIKRDDKESVASDPPTTFKEFTERICNGCKSVCSVARFG